MNVFFLKMEMVLVVIINCNGFSLFIHSSIFACFAFPISFSKYNLPHQTIRRADKQWPKQSSNNNKYHFINMKWHFNGWRWANSVDHSSSYWIHITTKQLISFFIFENFEELSSGTKNQKSLFELVLCCCFFFSLSLHRC